MKPGARHLPAHLAMCRKDQLMGSGTPEWRFSHAPSRRAEVGQQEGSTTHALSRTPVCLSVCVISLCPPSMGSLDCCPRGDTPLCRAGLCPFSCPTCGSEASGAPSPQSSAKKQCPLVGLAGAAPTPVRLRKDKPRAPALLPRTSDVPLGLERFPAVRRKRGSSRGSEGELPPPAVTATRLARCARELTAGQRWRRGAGACDGPCRARLPAGRLSRGSGEVRERETPNLETTTKRADRPVRAPPWTGRHVGRGART